MIPFSPNFYPTVTSATVTNDLDRDFLLPCFYGSNISQKLSPSCLAAYYVVLEKAVFDQVIRYFKGNKLIHTNLHGSRSGHDMSTALLQLYDKWVQELEDGKSVRVLFCDQSAGFDLCNHSLILGKLKLTGFEDTALAWVSSYLANRIQSCFVDGELSALLDLL